MHDYTIELIRLPIGLVCNIYILKVNECIDDQECFAPLKPFTLCLEVQGTPLEHSKQLSVDKCEEMGLLYIFQA